MRSRRAWNSQPPTRIPLTAPAVSQPAGGYPHSARIEWTVPRRRVQRRTGDRTRGTTFPLRHAALGDRPLMRAADASRRRAGHVAGRSRTCGAAERADHAAGGDAGSGDRESRTSSASTSATSWRRACTWAPSGSSAGPWCSASARCRRPRSRKGGGPYTRPPVVHVPISDRARPSTGGPAVPRVQKSETPRRRRSTRAPGPGRLVHRSVDDQP